MKKLLAVLLVLCMMFSMAACGGSGDGGGTAGGDTGNTSDAAVSGGDSGSSGGVMDRMGKMLTAGGRSYDKLITGKEGEKLTSTFFEFTISNVTSVKELEGYTPNTEGNKFITADVTVTNTWEEKDVINVGNYDFTTIWESEEELPEETYWAYTVFMDGMYTDGQDLNPGESASGKLVFEVPADVKDLGIAYQEIWDDDFIGNTYAVECSVE